MQFSNRRATLKDADAIAAVHVESWKTTYAGIVPDEYLASLDVGERAGMWKRLLASPDLFIFVAEDGTGVFGFVGGGRVREAISGFAAELYALYVLREHQGRGAGRLLTFALVDRLCEEGFESMLVWVLRENPAVSFYIHLGGVQIANKSIEIGGASLEESAFGWPSLGTCFKNEPSSVRDNSA
jgi:ribosomal protein S18 acetylase RimI-like enzyme